MEQKQNAQNDKQSYVEPKLDKRDQLTEVIEGGPPATGPKVPLP